MLRNMVYLLSMLVLLVAFQGAAAQEDAARPVHVMSVGGNQQGATRQFFGQVVARQTVDLAFQVGGQVELLPAAEGEVVPQGELVAELDLEPFQLQLEEAELQFERAERALERLNRLTSSVSEVAREDAVTDLGLARVALRNATVSLKNATLIAPFDALVAERKIANFSAVGQGTPVVRLHDMSELRIEIDVPEVLFQRAGEDADVTLFAQFPTGDMMHPLEIREFNAEASSVGQTFRLTLAVSDPSGLTVLPGSSATVFATLKTGDPILTIPLTALRIANDGTTSVLRFVPEGEDMGRLEEVPVVVEPNANGEAVVTSGLEAGELILRTGAHAVDPGTAVRRFAGYPD